MQRLGHGRARSVMPPTHMEHSSSSSVNVYFSVLCHGSGMRPARETRDGAGNDVIVMM